MGNENTERSLGRLILTVLVFCALLAVIVLGYIYKMGTDLSNLYLRYGKDKYISAEYDYRISAPSQWKILQKKYIHKSFLGKLDPFYIDESEFVFLKLDNNFEYGLIFPQKVESVEEARKELSKSLYDLQRAGFETTGKKDFKINGYYAYQLAIPDPDDEGDLTSGHFFLYNDNLLLTFLFVLHKEDFVQEMESIVKSLHSVIIKPDIQ